MLLKSENVHYLKHQNICHPNFHLKLIVQFNVLDQKAEKRKIYFSSASKLGRPISILPNAEGDLLARVLRLVGSGGGGSGCGHTEGSLEDAHPLLGGMPELLRLADRWIDP